MRFTVPRVAVAVILSLPLLCPAPVEGQSNSATIQGLVEDATGSVVPDALVVAINHATGVKYEGRTNGSGFFRLAAIEKGTYTLVVSKSGFAERMVDNLAVNANEVRDVGVPLSVAGLAEEVAVTAEAPVTNTTTSDVAMTTDSRQMRDLPLNGRDFTRLAMLTPGVSATYSNLSSMTFNGSSSEVSSNNFLLDGTDATNIENNRPSAGQERGPRLQTGSIEGLEEFKISTGTYSAEFGRASGAVVLVTSKSGTNRFSGNLFEFFRDDKLDAKNFFAPTNLPFGLHQFGGTLGGPIARDRTFFFFNYEGSRQDVGLTGRGTVPTAGALAGLPEVLQPLAQTFPAPTNAIDPLTGEVTRTGTLVTDEDVFALKLDHNFSPSDRLFARYSYNRGVVGGPAFALYNDYLGTDQVQDSAFTSQFVNVGYTKVISSNVLNELRVGLNLKEYDVNNGGSGQFPQVSIGGYRMIAGQLSTSRTSSNSLEIVNKLSWVRGRHAVKFGFNFRRPESTGDNNGFYSVSYPNLAGFLANQASSAVVLPAQDARTFSNWNTSFFVQDDWKVSARLTLNLGARYDYNTVLREAEDRAANYIGGSGPNLIGGSFSNLGEPLYEADRNNIGPRVGFAYDLFGNGRTVLRGGFGLYYAPTVISTSQTALSNPPGPGVYFLMPLPGQPLGIPLPDPTTGIALQRRPVAVAPDLQDGYTRQYSANVQRQFGESTLVQVGYFGYQGRDLLRFRNLNEFDKTTFARPDPRWSGILLYESAGKSSYNALQVWMKRRFGEGLVYGLAYTLAHLKDDVPTGSSPQNPLDMGAEWADGDGDVRHNLSMHMTYELPLAKWFGPSRATEGWQVNAILVARSGLPLDVKLGYDSYGNNSYNERPDLVPGASTGGSPKGNRGFINPQAYKEPAPGTYGNAPRNSARGPAFRQLDLSFFKTTSLVRSHQVQFRFEIFNVTNTPNFSNAFVGTTLTSGTPGTINPNFGVGSETFGRTIGLGTARQMQLAVKYLF